MAMIPAVGPTFTSPVFREFQPGIQAADIPAFLAEVHAKENSIPLNFFTAAEEKTIRSLFDYHLVDHLSLLDLWGFDFYQNLASFIENLKLMLSRENSRTATSVLEPYLNGFCQDFFSLYVRIFRSSIKNRPTTSSKILNTYLLPKETFIEKLEKLHVNLKECIKVTFQTAHEGASRAQHPEIKKAVLLTRYRSALNHLSKLDNLKNLWIKIARSPYCQFFFVDSNSTYFPGSEKLSDRPAQLNPLTPISELPGIQDTFNFIAFLSHCFTHGAGSLGFSSTHFNTQLQFLRLHQHKPVTIEFIQTWNQLFHETISLALKLRENFTEDLKLALNGQLTHKTWLKKNHLELKRPKDQTEFCESLFLAKLCSILLEALQDDVNKIIELRLLHAYFPGLYRTKHVTVQLMLDNLYLFSYHARETPLTLESKMPPDLQNSMLFLQNQVNAVCQPFYKVMDQPHLSDQINRLYFSQTQNTLPYSSFFKFIHELSPACQLLKDLEKKLPLIQKSFEERVSVSLNLVPAEIFQNERQRWQKELQEGCLQQSIKILNLISFLNDVNSVLQKHTFLKDFDFIVLPAFRAFFTLTLRMKRIFKKVVSPTPLVLEPELPKQPILSPPLPILVQINDNRPPSPPLSGLLKQLKTATKRREFEDILQELNFTFLRHGKGSHQIWTNEEGNQIVLPFHNGSSTIKPGTRQGIIKQIAQSQEK